LLKIDLLDTLLSGVGRKFIHHSKKTKEFEGGNFLREYAHSMLSKEFEDIQDMTQKSNDAILILRFPSRTLSFQFDILFLSD
jgi:hypothetical protein